MPPSFYLFLLPGLCFSEEVEYKLGPILNNQLQIEEQSVKDLRREKLIKIIVVMDRDPLLELSEEDISELQDRVNDLGGYIGNHAFNN